MSDDQSVRIGFVPYVWTYIAISLNPEATVRLACDNVDDIARAEIQDLAANFKTYPGFCEALIESLPCPNREFHRIRWYPLQKGLSQPTPASPVEPHMCVPVFPNTEHPHNRPAVHTTKPLPWSDCYHPTSPSFQFRVDGKDIDYSNATELDGMDGLRFRRQVHLDVQRIEELKRAKSVGFEPPPLLSPEDHVAHPDTAQTRAVPSSPAPCNEVTNPVPIATKAQRKWRLVRKKPPPLDTDVQNLRPLFRPALNPNYADPANDRLFVPNINISPNLENLGEQLPDFHDLIQEWKILKGIVNRAKERAEKTAGEFTTTNPVIETKERRKRFCPRLRRRISQVINSLKI